LAVVPGELQLRGAGLFWRRFFAIAGRRGEFFFFGRANQCGEGIVDGEALVVEVLQNVCPCRPSEGFAGSFESSVSKIEQSPERGCPRILVCFENSELIFARSAIYCGLCVVLEHSKLGRCRDDKSPRVVEDKR